MLALAYQKGAPRARAQPAGEAGGRAGGRARGPKGCVRMLALAYQKGACACWPSPTKRVRAHAGPRLPKGCVRMLALAYQKGAPRARGRARGTGGRAGARGRARETGGQRDLAEAMGMLAEAMRMPACRKGAARERASASCRRRALAAPEGCGARAGETGGRDRGGAER